MPMHFQTGMYTIFRNFYCPTELSYLIQLSSFVSVMRNGYVFIVLKDGLSLCLTFGII